MLSQLIRFEFCFYSRQLSYTVSGLCFLALGLLLPFGGYGGDQVQVNAPFVVSVMMGMLSLMTLFVITVFSGNGLARDQEYGMVELVYSTALSKHHYFLARFIGLFLSVLSILFFGVMGILLGTLLVEADKLGSFSLLHYIVPFLIIIVPNLLFSVAVLLAIAVLTQRAKVTYFSGVLLFVFYLLGSVLGNSPLLANASPTSPEHQFIAILLDPFGLAGVFGQSKHWSVVERNSFYIPMQGAFLLNRLLWPLVGMGIIALVYQLFSFRLPVTNQKRAKASCTSYEVLQYKPVHVSTLSFNYHWNSCLAMLKMEIVLVFRSSTFWAFLALWIVYLSMEVSNQLFSGMLGIASFPTTGAILELLIPEKLVILLLIFYCGEIIWSERSAGIHQLKEATPLGNICIYVSKLLAFALLIVLLLFVSIITALLIQAWHHYYHFEPSKYLSLFYYSGIPLLIFGTLFTLVQTLVNNKYLGILISGILVGVSLYGARFGMEHPLLRFGDFPNLIHSDMNGFANKEKAFHWLLVYWSAFAGLVLVYGAVVWKRGVDRRAIPKISAMNKGIVWQGACCLVIFLASGGYISYEMHVLAGYRSAASQMDWQAAYEKKYKPFCDLEQPTILQVQTWVDLYPEERMYKLQGRYQVKNTITEDITKLLINLSPQVNMAEIAIEGFCLQSYDKEFGQYWFISKEPLKPGKEVAVLFKFTVQNQVFAQFNSENSIVHNGSYIELEKMLPQFGYNFSYELEDQKEREKRGLPEGNSWSDLQKYSQDKYNKVTYETIISTNNGQQPVSVGKLVKSWKAGDRKFYQYKAEKPVPFMFAIAAANYTKLSDCYKNIAIEFYYHQGHEYNIPTMLESVKHTLRYMEENIGPYPFSHLRVVEIPHYPGVATAYPGVVFVRESGYLQDFRNPSDLNYAYTIGHEVAHQWWGIMLEPANMQGYKFLTETMTQYVEHAILEERWGKEQVAEFLKNQLDVYLVNRVYAEKTELPLLKTEDEHYVHYQKGAVVMNGIKELIGEKSLNEALRNFFSNNVTSNKKPTSLQFLDELFKRVDSSHYNLLDFWINKVFLYELYIKDADYRKIKEGYYEVKIRCMVDKLMINDDGQEGHLPFSETLQIGVYDEKNELILLKSFLIEEKFSELLLYINKKPKKVVLDPYITRLDNNPMDNVFLLE